MIKRMVANILCWFGKPAKFAIAHAINTEFKLTNTNLWWSAPMSLMTFPLLPLALGGDKLLNEVDKKEFLERTRHLPKVYLPKDFLYIESSEDGWLVQPFYDDGEEEPFESEFDARLFLKNLHYHEVISKDTDRFLTFWIKDNVSY